ncbi:MAG TPA: ubiquinol oxidase subunit II [Acetobacteraceae bacterium]|nr:ubiquinol oxidase subunit II [Acetobacteraceae bacterium]
MRRAALRRHLLTALCGGLPALTGCSGGVLEPRGPIGAANRIILFNALEIMLAIVIPTIIAALVFAWWFRESNLKARYRPRFAYSGRIELIVWAIPLLVICFLGGVIWIGAHELDPARPIESEVKPLEVQVVSLDWKWLFIYPDQGVASVNQLVVPVSVPLHFDLTSASVMNVFFVPQLGSMIYTMNRMVTQLYLQADQAGDYHGLSAQFSGDGFPDMQFTVRAVAQGEFTNWIANTRQAGPVLDRAGYADLSRQNTTKAFTYRQADPSLFRAVVTQQIPPQPGPNTESSEQRVHPTPEH